MTDSTGTSPVPHQAAPEPVEVASARMLLGCRPGATSGEVRYAYRRALLQARPDLGHVNGTWMAQVQQARDLLLAVAPHDRRRHPRHESRPPAQVEPLRRSSWDVTPPPQPALDLAL
jgi:hypothetical protein